MSKFKVGDRVAHAKRPSSAGTVKTVLKYSILVIWDHGALTAQRPSELISLPSNYAPQPISSNEVFCDGTINYEETRATSSSGAEKGVKPETFSLIPVEALEQVARHYGVGAKKYAPHNWRAGYEWSKSYDALQRHANAFWRGEDTDQETGSPHMAAVAFHALTLLTFMQEQPEYDDRYKEQS